MTNQNEENVQWKETGDSVTCTFASGPWYKVGNVYPVLYRVPPMRGEGGARYVQGSDGFYDNLSAMVSKFSGNYEKNNKRKARDVDNYPA